MAKDYKVLMDNSRSVLQEDVRKHLRSGWKLHGTLQVIADSPSATNIKVTGGAGGTGKLGVGGKGGDASTKVIQTSEHGKFFVQAVIKD